MKIVHSDRNYLYSILSTSFNMLKIKPAIIELGVLNGENAKKMQQFLLPKKMVLLDAWSCDIFDDYRRNNANRVWVDPIDNFHGYFGGALSEQKTFDQLYLVTQNLFATDTNVSIIRQGTKQGRDILRQSDPNLKFDLIYIDASHQFETVFDDLMLYENLVSDAGCIMLNDCCHSNAGIRQNIGVLEATVKFIKMTDFIPVAVTNTDWSDIILLRKDSPLREAIHNSILNSDKDYVEIPPQLLGNLKVINGSRPNLSFN